jgi:hypothetical protein
MSFKVTKLLVGKGRTEGNEEQERWIRRYYEVEVIIEDEHDIELAKASVEGLIDGWLTGAKEIEPTVSGTASKSQHPSAWVSGPQSFNMTKIPWVKAEGEHGIFEKSTAWDNVDHKALLKYLADEHQGKATVEGFFVWVMPDKVTIGRKIKRG